MALLRAPLKPLIKGFIKALWGLVKGLMEQLSRLLGVFIADLIWTQMRMDRMGSTTPTAVGCQEVVSQLIEAAPDKIDSTVDACQLKVLIDRPWLDSESQNHNGTAPKPPQ
jgi:hypothetical protein